MGQKSKKWTSFRQGSPSPRLHPACYSSARGTEQLKILQSRCRGLHTAFVVTKVRYGVIDRGCSCLDGCSAACRSQFAWQLPQKQHASSLCRGRTSGSGTGTTPRAKMKATYSSCNYRQHGNRVHACSHAQRHGRAGECLVHQTTRWCQLSGRLVSAGS